MGDINQRIQDIERQYQLLNSDESWDYTEKILTTIGNEIQMRFPGVEFDLKARFKSPKSVKEKLNRYIKSGKIEKKGIDDMIGICLVVKSVSDDFEFEHKLCERSVEERSNIGLDVANEESSITINDSKIANALGIIELDKCVADTMIEIERLEKSDRPDQRLIDILKRNLNTINGLNGMVTDLQKTVKSKSNKIINIGKKYYAASDNSINEMIARYIMNTLVSDKNFLENLGLEREPDRMKNHDGGKSGYYVAYHNSVRNKENQEWKLDIHAMSEYNYIQQKEGDAKHANCEGKARTFPKVGREGIAKEEFIKAVLEAAPKNLVYQNGTKTKKGKVYRCSDLENMVYFYTEVLKDNPELFYELIADETLFSDKQKTAEDR